MRSRLIEPSRVSFQLAVAVAATLLTGCSLFRWSGYTARTQAAAPAVGNAATDAAYQIATSSRPTPTNQFTKDELESLYYADLGAPDIDVSQYPPEEKANYAAFQQVCSRCHTLARAVYSPTIDRRAWYYYVFKMRFHSAFRPGTAYTHDEAKQIYDFLVYDSYIRKVKDRETFETITRHLQNRFAQTIEERMRRLQNSPTKILVPNTSH